MTQTFYRDRNGKLHPVYAQRQYVGGYGYVTSFLVGTSGSWLTEKAYSHLATMGHIIEVEQVDAAEMEAEYADYTLV